MSNTKLEELVAGWDLQVRDPEAGRKQLEEAVNGLIAQDFGRLVSILYRIDVSESRLKSELAARPGEDAAAIIAALILSRLEEKRRSREKFPCSGDIPDDERW